MFSVSMFEMCIPMLNTRTTVECQGLEIYCKENVKASRPHLYLCFKSPADRNDFYQQLLQQKGTPVFHTTVAVLSFKFQVLPPLNRHVVT